MAAQLNINGHIIQLGEEITYNFRIGDIADLSTLKSNYTSSFQIPRTSEIVQLFEGLGIPSDMSSFPYKITNVQCLDDYSIVYEGALVILKTDDHYYHSTVISGSYDLASALEDDTLYDSGIRLTPKSFNNVTSGSSFFLSDDIPDTFFYLQPFIENTNEITEEINYVVNIDVSAQAYKIEYLLDQIFGHIGFTYELPDTVDLTDETLVVPNPPLLDIAVTGQSGVWARNNTTVTNIRGENDDITGYQNWDSVYVDVVLFAQSGYNFTCSYPGDYVFIFEYFFANARFYLTGTINGEWIPCIVELRVNGNTIGRFTANSRDSDTSQEKYRTITNLNIGDVVSIVVLRPQELNGLQIQFERANTSFMINSLVLDDAKHRQALSLKLIDFIKEICYRYMLIPIQVGNHINFISLYDIFNDWNAIDWSDKYIDRTEESYTLDYAYNNWLRHSYVNEGEDEFDLNLKSNNHNAGLSKDIINSRIFAPSTNSNNSLDYVIYEVEEDSSGKVKYKTNNRYFFARAEFLYRPSDTRFRSRTLPGFLGVQGRKFILPQYTAAFSDSTRWTSLERVLTNTKSQSINLNLSVVDVNQLQVDRLYYFKQEQAFYILNTLRYTKGQEAIGQFTRVLCAYGWEAYTKHCEVVAGDNTGRVIIDEIRNLASGEIKSNNPNDIDYMPPYFDPCECPSNTPVQIFWLSISARGENLQFLLNEGGNVNRIEIRNSAGTVVSSQENSNQNKSVYVPDTPTNYYTYYRGVACDVTVLESTGGDLSSMSVDMFTNLERLVMMNNLSMSGTFDISNNKLLSYVDIRNNGFTTGTSFQLLNKVIIDLDDSGVLNGTLIYANNNTSGAQPTNASRQAYLSLLDKGWAITGRPPLI